MIYLLFTWLAAPVLSLLASVRRQAEPQRILLIQTAKIGDLISATPLLPQLRRRFPAARLSVLVAAETAPLLQHSPIVDQVLVVPKLAGLRLRLALLQMLLPQRFDLTICASPNQALLLLPFWAAVPRRLSILPERPSRSYRLAAVFQTGSENHRAGRMTIETLFALLSPLGIEPSRTKHVIGHPDGPRRVAAILGQSVGRLAGVGISAGNKLKELPLDMLAGIVGGLLRVPGLHVVLIGGPGDEQRAGELMKLLPAEKVRSLAGCLRLDEMPALMERLGLYVGVDSGMTYLADACGVPVMDLMGPADADDQRPTGPRAIVLRPAVSCAPCSHAFDAPYRCHTGTHECLRAYDLGAMLRQAEEILVSPGPTD